MDSVSPASSSPDMFQTPPNAGKKPPQNKSLGHLIKLHEMGVLTKEELRAAVLGITFSAPAPSPSPSPPTPASQPPLPQKRKTPEVSVKVTKKREGKPVAAVSTLRSLIKNPTRRRYFQQCRDPDSVLWSQNPGGYETMNVKLFNAASNSPIRLIIYEKHPGKTSNVKRTAIRNIMKWQVRKDRANYKHNEPKREICFGEVLVFDWEGKRDELRRAEAPSPIATLPPAIVKPAPKETKSIAKPAPAPIATLPPAIVKPAPAPIVTLPPAIVKPAPKETNSIAIVTVDVDNMKPCHTCGHALWIGLAKSVPSGIQIAYPLNFDWENKPNTEPYCKKCWDDEEQLLSQMISKHKAVGPPKKKKAVATKKKTVAVTKQPTAAPAPPKKKKPVVKRSKYKVFTMCFISTVFFNTTRHIDL